VEHRSVEHLSERLLELLWWNRRRAGCQGRAEVGAVPALAPAALSGKETGGR
jgi:hypothetical protein